MEVKNTSKGIFKKLFGQKHIEKIFIHKEGIRVDYHNGENKNLLFDDIIVVRPQFFWKATAPYYVLTIKTKDEIEYVIEMESSMLELKRIFKLLEEFNHLIIPETLDVFNYIVVDREKHCVKFENGKLIDDKKGNIVSYDVNDIEYYKIDYSQEVVNLKIKGKKLYYQIFFMEIKNVFYLLKVLEKTLKKGSLLQ